MNKQSFLRFLTFVLLWRTAAVVFLTGSVWLTLWFYDWSARNLGENYAHAFGCVSGITAAGVIVACIFKGAAL